MKILIITWYFPPANDVGAIRMGKMADFFHANGHTVHVLTATRKSDDNSLATELPEEQITKTSWYDVDRIGWRSSGRPDTEAQAKKDRRSNNNSVWRRASDQFRHFVRMPDQQIGWLPFLYSAGKSILERERFDFIYASGPPFTTFIGAKWLARRFNLPWIAEYRDGWSGYVYTPKPPWRQAIDRRLENDIVRTSSGIVAVSEPWAEYYSARFRKPTTAIYNGFDPEQSQDQLKIEPDYNSPLIITYLGIMYGGLRDPSTLYEAIKLSGLGPESVQIRYYGPRYTDILPLAEKYGVLDFISVHQRIPYQASLKVQRLSDVLLLLQSSADDKNVPAKTFEYFAVRRPIIGLGLDGGIPARLVRERKAGIYLTDAVALAEQLKCWVEEKRRTGTIEDLPEKSREGLSRADQLYRLEGFLSSLGEEAKQTVRLGNLVLGKTHNTHAHTARLERRPNIFGTKPLLVTTVDAEEAFDWSLALSRHASDVRSMQEQSVAHRIFERYGVVPTYLVTYPVVAQDNGCALIAEYLKDGKCEIGAQLHPWVTPPYEEPVSLYNSFACNLSPKLQFEKTKELTDSIVRRFGVAPQIYRAGRYGIGPDTAGILNKLGYRIDSSVVPEYSYQEEGGPEFFGQSVVPSWIDRDRGLLELPLTSSYVGLLVNRNEGQSDLLHRPENTYRLIRGIAARTHLMERIRLTPEGTGIDAAKRLVRTLVRRGIQVFVLSYHAPSLIPGNTPYVKSLAERERFLMWLEEFYEFFMGEIGGVATTPMAIHELACRTEMGVKI